MAGGLTFQLLAQDGPNTLAEIDTYDHATIVARWNDVSTYDLLLPATSLAAEALLAASVPRLQLLAMPARGGQQTLRSGPVTRFERSLGDDGAEMLAISGVDDLVWLRRRVAHPQPGTATPPYNATAYDVRSGPVSTVLAGYVDRNLGPSAVPARQVAGFTIDTPAAFGPNVSVQARYDNLLVFLQSIANQARVGIRARNLRFQVFQPAGGAVFAVDLGTLAGWTGVVEVPEANYVYVGGQGEGTARTIREVADTAAVLQWGRVETFQDRRDTNDAAQMDQAGAETLADARHPPTITMQAVDTLSQAFLTDWDVGDLASVTIGGTTYQDVIAEATIDLQPNEPPAITPALGDVSINLAQWRRLNATMRRVRQLERV